MTTTVRELYRMDEVSLYTPPVKFRNMVQIEPVESERGIGIEIEVENHALKAGVSSGAWSATADGSLRNAGQEYVSRPMMAKYAPQMLQELLGDCLDANECCFSPRTSIHVHVNMQDVPTDVVEDIVLLYSVFEKLFFRFTGRGRIKNIYCVPIIDTDVMNHMKTVGFNHVRAAWSKYAALNLLPVAEYGTIEFRHMHGTFDIKKVCVWIRLITKLVDYVVANKGCSKTIAMMGPGFDYPTLLKDIFGLDAEYLKYQHYNDVKQGVGRTKTAFTSNKTVQALMTTRDMKSAYFLGQ